MRAIAPKTPPQRPARQEPEGFDRLYRDHVDLMYRYAYRLCGEAESAKDLVQETFLNAYQGLKDFRGDARVSTWLYTIASRACIRMRRKRKGQPEHELSLEEFVPTSEGAGESFIRHANNPFAGRHCARRRRAARALSEDPRTEKG